MKEEINWGGNPDPKTCPYSHDVYKSNIFARRAHYRLFLCKYAFCQPKRVQKKKKKRALSIFLEINSHAVKVPQEEGRTWINIKMLGQVETWQRITTPDTGGRGRDCSTLSGSWCPVWVGCLAKGSLHGTLAQYASMVASVPCFCNLLT